MRNHPLMLIPGDPSPDNEAEFISRIQKGDTAAFEIVFAGHYDALVRFACTFVATPEDARDIVCEVFSSIWQSHTAWRPGVGIRAYLFGAVRNRCYNYIRDRKHRGELLGNQHPTDLPLPKSIDNTVDADLDREAQWDAVRRAIHDMRGLRREAMRLRWIEQMGHAEIASVMGISVNAVQLHLSLALKALRAQFGRPGDSGE